MGNRLTILLDKEATYAGGQVQGVIYVEAGESLEFNELTLELSCDETFEYSASSAFELSVHESKRLISAEFTVIKELNPYIGGQHAFPFKISLPHCPGSLHFEHGALSLHITYLLRAKLSKPHHMQVLESDPLLLHVNEPMVVKNEPLEYSVDHKVTHSYCCTQRTSGVIRLGLRTDKSSYIPGEAVKISLSVKNSTNESIGKVTVSLGETACLLFNESQITETKIWQQRVICESLQPEKFITQSLELLVPVLQPPADSLCISRRACGRHCLFLHSVILNVESPQMAQLIVPIVIDVSPKITSIPSAPAGWKPSMEHQAAQFTVSALKKSFGLHRFTLPALGTRVNANYRFLFF